MEPDQIPTADEVQVLKNAWYEAAEAASVIDDAAATAAEVEEASYLAYESAKAAHAKAIR
jgi:hypothetical protein